MGTTQGDGLRPAEQEDWLEDLFHAVRELQASGMEESLIRRYVSQTLRGQTPAQIRSRVEIQGT